MIATKPYLKTIKVSDHNFWEISLIISFLEASEVFMSISAIVLAILGVRGTMTEDLVFIRVLVYFCEVVCVKVFLVIVFFLWKQGQV